LFPPANPRAENSTLNVWTLGDSITWGTSSSDGNGYRKDLRQNLTTLGYHVNMQGTVQGGNMHDNQTDGHGGYTVEQLYPFPAKEKATKQPVDVVLLMAGTNNVNRNSPAALAAAPDHLGQLVDWVLGNDTSATVLVAQITPFVWNETADALAVTYNKALVDVVDKRAKQGKHVALVDMHGALQKADFGNKDIHPNDGGYNKMAGVWVKGIQAAAKKGWIH
jgi:lysophospholipase L1-like esterase